MVYKIGWYASQEQSIPNKVIFVQPGDFYDIYRSIFWKYYEINKHFSPTIMWVGIKNGWKWFLPHAGWL